MARDRKHSFSVFWDLTGMNWPRVYGGLLLSDASQSAAAVHLHSMSQLAEEREERTFSCNLSLASLTEGSCALWAKPATGGGRGMPVIPCLSS